MALRCLRKHTWHIYSASWIIQDWRAHLLACSHILKTEMCFSVGNDSPDVKSLRDELIEKDRKPAGLPCSHLLPIKQVSYSILRQDAIGTWARSTAIVGWKVQQGLRGKKYRLLPFYLKENGTLNKEGKLSTYGDEERTVRKRQISEGEAEGTVVGEILLSTLWHGRKWHVESSKRKLDRYRLVW